jgi:hypothetical protein
MLMWMAVSLAGNGQPAARAQEDVPSEYEMKAAFLFNFAKFVEWPADAVRDPHAPFVIGVFGMSPFGDALEQSVKGKTANNRPLTVRQFQNLSEVKGCQILFISKSERKRVREVAKALDRRPVLTVSEVDRFMHTGLMVNFFKEGNKVRFEINDEVAKKAGLRISSKLLTLSRRQEDK